MLIKKSIGIIGTGCMGEHIVKMLIKQSDLSSDPVRLIGSYRTDEKKQQLINKFGSNMSPIKHNKSIVLESDIIILCVKPMQVKEVCEEICLDIPVICTAAAIPLDILHQWLPSTNHIIRCMPNIACGIGHGVVTFYSKSLIANKIMDELFKPNLVMEVDSDTAIDSSTLIGGCGPAFFAWWAKCLKSINKSIPDDKIDQMIAQTMLGTAMMMQTSTSDEIIKAVASPKGATEATLESFKTKGLDQEVNLALKIALERINSISASVRISQD